MNPLEEKDIQILKEMFRESEARMEARMEAMMDRKIDALRTENMTVVKASIRNLSGRVQTLEEARHLQ